jgi:hypothetical protein
MDLHCISPNIQESFIGVGQYCAFAEDLGVVVLAGQTKTGQHTLGTVHPKTGVWKHILSLPAADNDVLGGASTYVPKKHLFVFQLGVSSFIDVFTVNIVTGAVQNFTDQGKSAIYTMSFNPADDMIYGMAIKAGPGGGTDWARSIASLNPETLKVATIGTIPTYSMLVGGISTVNAAANSIYWIGQTGPPGGDAPYFLVQSSLKDASTISVSDHGFCPNPGAAGPPCPASLEYRNAE